MAENRVRALRKQKGLTLAQLAARMEPPADVAGLQKIETGKTRLSLPWIKRISAALGIEPAELIAGEPVPIACGFVPVLDCATAAQWKEAGPMAGDQLPVVAPPRDAFAIRIDESGMDRLLPCSGHLIIAPHERELLDGRSYLIIVEGTDSLATIRRFRVGSPPVFEAIWPTGGNNQVPLGVEPLRVIGRIAALHAQL
jgi:transcriptional regulator with XRE-family HTH domain